METVTITARGFPTLEVTLGDGYVTEMVERDPDGAVIQRWEAAPEEPQPDSTP